MRRRLATAGFVVIGAAIVFTVVLQCNDGESDCASFCGKYGYCYEAGGSYDYYDYYDDDDDDEGWTEDDQDECEDSCDDWRDDDDLYDCMMDCRSKYECHAFEECMWNCYYEDYDYDDYYYYD